MIREARTAGIRKASHPHPASAVTEADQGERYMRRAITWIKENPIEAACYTFLISVDVVIYFITRGHPL